MKTLICTMGLPRSGKSTWTREQNVPIVNPDAVRLAIHGRRFWGPAEKQVWSTVELMVKALFNAGHDTVIMDATNTTRKQRDQWKSDEWDTVFHYVDTSPAICESRALYDQMPDLVEVIQRMVDEFEPIEDDEIRNMTIGGFGDAEVMGVPLEETDLKTHKSNCHCVYCDPNPSLAGHENR